MVDVRVIEVVFHQSIVDGYTIVVMYLQRCLSRLLNVEDSETSFVACCIMFCYDNLNNYFLAMSVFEMDEDIATMLDLNEMSVGEV